MERTHLFSSYQSLRKTLRTQRSALPIVFRQTAAIAVAEHLHTWPFDIPVHHMAAYWAINGELDPLPAVKSFHSQVYLPVITDHPVMPLGFAPYDTKTPLQPNRFGIPEPVVPKSLWRAAVALDVVLLPLVAFDETGTRLGMGGGFYDRSLAFCRTAAVRPLLIGVGYAFQQVEHVVRAPWDVPLDAVVTETGVHMFNAVPPKRADRPDCPSRSRTDSPTHG